MLYSVFLGKFKNYSDQKGKTVFYHLASLVAQCKEMAVNAGDLGSIPGSGRSPGGGNGNPLQCSCLGNTMDRGAWWAIVHGVNKESDMSQ